MSNALKCCKSNPTKKWETVTSDKSENDTEITRIQTGTVDFGSPTVHLLYKDKPFTIEETKEKQFVIGRDEACEFQVDLSVASRKHCLIKFDNNHAILEDLSTNGTYVKVGQSEPVLVNRRDFPLVGRGSISLGKELNESSPDIIFYKVEFA